MHPTVADELLDVIDSVARREVPIGDGGGGSEGGERESAALGIAVRRLSDAYTRRGDGISQLQPSAESLAARLRFFLPRDLPKLWGPLSELDRVGAMPAGQSLRVLDVGCGLGTTSLAAALYFDAQQGSRALQITAVDNDQRALGIMRKLLDACAPLLATSISIVSHKADVSGGKLPRTEGGYDLIFAGLILNELTEADPTPEARLERGRRFIQALSTRLSPHGVIIVLEPALRPQSRLLQLLRAEVIGNRGKLHVFAPCTHAEACPLLVRERDWCHDRSPLALPARLRPIAARAGLREQGLSYSYLTLMAQPRSLAELARTDDGTGARQALRAVGGPLKSKGKVELDVCGPGGTLRLMQLRRKRAEPAQDLALLGRGTVLSLTPGADTTGSGRYRLQDGEPRVHQAWSTSSSVINPVPERAE